jgi:hypothetical protein
VRWSTGAPSLPLLIFFPKPIIFFSPTSPCSLLSLSFFFFWPVRWKILHKFCRPVPSKKKKKICLYKTRFFFFVAGEERDGAPERGTGIGLESETVHRRGLVFGVGLGWTPVPSIGSCGLVSGKITATVGERQRRGREREQRRNGGRKMMGMFYMVF